MATVIYVCRAFGSTLILQVAPPVPVPTLVVVATFRDGAGNATYRDGNVKGTYRDGVVMAGGR